MSKRQMLWPDNTGLDEAVPKQGPRHIHTVFGDGNGNKGNQGMSYHVFIALSGKCPEQDSHNIKSVRGRHTYKHKSQQRFRYLQRFNFDPVDQNQITVNLCQLLNIRSLINII